MENKKYILGIMSLTITVIGGVFKINHWPFAGIILVLGVFFLCFVFLPWALISSYRGEGSKQKALYIVAYITVSIDFVGAVFKIMHWPGASIMMLFGILLPVVLFLPVYIYFHFKSGTESLTNFMYVMFLLVYLSVMSAMLSLRINKSVIDNAVRVNSLMDTGKYLAKMNQGLAQKNESGGQLSVKTIDLIEVIHDLKEELILAASSENQMAIISDSEINEWNIQGLDNINVTEEIFFGEKGKAEMLKSRVEQYKEYLLGLIDDTGMVDEEFISTLLSTEKVYTNSRGEKLDWETYYFRHLPLVIVFNNLTQLENNIWLAEAEVLQTALGEDENIQETKNLGLSGLSNIGSLFLQFTWSDVFR